MTTPQRRIADGPVREIAIGGRISRGRDHLPITHDGRTPMNAPMALWGVGYYISLVPLDAWRLAIGYERP
jgi:hypothetical protein